MKRLALLLAFVSAPAVAQSAAVPDLRAAKNAAARAETACSKNTQQAKCKTETGTLLRHAQNADAIVNPTPTPSPVPTPTPTPPATGWVPSPSLDGGPPIAADFPVSEGLVRAWGTGDIPGPYAPDEGAFRFICGGEAPLSYDDPLVYPGQPGAAHLHYPFGRLPFDASLTSENLRNSLQSTCNYGGKALNRSAYWIPAPVDAVGYVRLADWIAVYYKRFKASSPACDPANPRRMGICVGLPNQIRILTGWDQTRPDEPGRGAKWYCTGGTGVQSTNLDEVFASGCKAGDQLIADVVFPDCWSGKHLDSPDHRSHMAWPSYGDWGYLKCPATHPYVIPQTTNKYSFTVTADMYETVSGVVRSRLRLSSDHMKAGAKPGETLHSDYMEQWVEAAKKMWTENCIDKGLDCSGGDLGNGLQLLGASIPAYGWTNPNPRVPVPARP